MSKNESASTFIEPVEGIGTFTFTKRRMREQFRVEAEFARLTEGAPVAADVSSLAMSVACLRVLTVEAPEGWNLDEMDPEDGDTYSKILRVYGALRAREDAFRAKPKAASEGDRKDEI